MSQDPVRLLPPAEAAELPAADADGQRVLDRVAEGSNVVVLGAPGTGKTSLALRLLAEAVAGGRDAVLLAPTRARADWLRGRAAHLLREGHGDGVVRVRTPAALALTILTTSLTMRTAPLPPPVLLAGAEEDSALASMVSTVIWPGLPAEATGSRAFRSELRNLLPAPESWASAPTTWPTWDTGSTSPSGGPRPSSCAPGTHRGGPAPSAGPRPARWTRLVSRTAPSRP